MPVSNISTFSPDLALTQAVEEGQLRPDLKETVQDVILKRHRHQYEEEHGNDLDVRLLRTIADLKRRSSLHRDREASTPKRVTKYFFSSFFIIS